MLPIILAALAALAAPPTEDVTPIARDTPVTQFEQVTIEDPSIYDGVYVTTMGTMTWKDGKGTFDSPRGGFDILADDTDFRSGKVWISWRQFDTSVPLLNNERGYRACEDGTSWGLAYLEFDKERNSFRGYVAGSACSNPYPMYEMDWEGRRVRSAVFDMPRLPKGLLGTVSTDDPAQIPPDPIAPVNNGPIYRPGVADALNPQPLPPVDRPGVVDALNPQPLPPVDRPGVADVALNPQPLPPIDRPGVTDVALNPQPLPPVSRESAAIPLPSIGQEQILAGAGCPGGLVPRAARAGDDQCVDPGERDLIARENASAATNYDPNGAYGPSSCKAGLVWREAYPGDSVCVTPERRQAIRDGAN